MVRQEVVDWDYVVDFSHLRRRAVGKLAAAAIGLRTLSGIHLLPLLSSFFNLQLILLLSSSSSIAHRPENK